MIHIATVHWFDDAWIDIQLAYLKRYLPSDSYLVYAFLNGIDPEKYRDKIHYISTEPIQPHAIKLNLLAEKICSQADSNDTICFLDGDAFPVGDIAGYIDHSFKKVNLIAIQRLENEGDPQPHPSFCATTIKFWKEIEGDWRQGPSWKTQEGRLRTDVGALLWKKLENNGIEWQPMHRSNAVNLHPLWFGLYDDLIYHHGAAFRTPYCTIDIRCARQVLWKRFFMNVADTRIIGMIKRGWVQNAIYSFVMKKEIEAAFAHSRDIISEIPTNFHFAERFKR